jgi:hypothetical protein
MIRRNEGRVSLFLQGSVSSTIMLTYELRSTLHCIPIAYQQSLQALVEKRSSAGLARLTRNAERHNVGA